MISLINILNNNVYKNNIEDDLSNLICSSTPNPFNYFKNNVSNAFDEEKNNLLNEKENLDIMFNNLTLINDDYKQKIKEYTIKYDNYIIENEKFKELSEKISELEIKYNKEINKKNKNDADKDKYIKKINNLNINNILLKFEISRINNTIKDLENDSFKVKKEFEISQNELFELKNKLQKETDNFILIQKIKEQSIYNLNRKLNKENNITKNDNYKNNIIIDIKLHQFLHIIENKRLTKILNKSAKENYELSDILSKFID